jgi:hypothetical protein
VWQNAIHTQSEATQQWVSALVGGAASGGMTGASTALDGEKYNRQLHQREIAWIKKNAAAFARANGMSQKDAQMLLTISALGMVDAQNSATLQQMIRNGTISQRAVHNAQNYIKGHTVGESFHDEHHYDDSFGHDQGLFTVNPKQFFDHSYDPNTMKAGAVPVSPLDYLPVGRGAGAALRGVGKKGAKNTTALPDSYWIKKKAPTQIEPGTRTVTIQKPSRSGGTYTSTSHYDEFGRLTGQTHRTDHGRPDTHPSPHHHRRDPITGENIKAPDGSKVWHGLYGN